MPDSLVEWAVCATLYGALAYVVLWRLGLRRTVALIEEFNRWLARGLEALVRRLADGRDPVGIRPNQSPGPRRCRHTANPPVPVEVYDTLDGRPEIARWLCPDCYEETHGPPPPPPKGPGGSSRLGGITTAEAIEGVRRIQYALQQETNEQIPRHGSSVLLDS